MATSLVPSDRSPNSQNPEFAPDFAEMGWCYAELEQADGSIATIKIPLTPEEFLHPKEGYYLPNIAVLNDFTRLRRVKSPTRSNLI